LSWTQPLVTTFLSIRCLEWFRAKVVKVNTDAGTYDVEHEYNGYIDKDLCRLCVRWYEPPEVGDEVIVRVFTRKAYPGTVVAVHDDGTFDVQTEKMGLREHVNAMDIRTFDWTWWVGTNVEVKMNDDLLNWERGFIIAENDGIYDVQLESSAIERGVETERIRPFLP
jgi:hypothetical protein